ncbi:MAG: class I SAM-dependent methyltransferase [Planctomycetota bacterium]|nr:MAG: class I SAM-dependent methyltransferase [Planctomycetota bacterium]REK44788.1 MAG: class I SAM-dependent methyltransferase [Planctomycetota bacterium]
MRQVARKSTTRIAGSAIRRILARRGARRAEAWPTSSRSPAADFLRPKRHEGRRRGGPAKISPGGPAALCLPQASVQLRFRALAGCRPLSDLGAPGGTRSRRAPLGGGCRARFASSRSKTSHPAAGVDGISQAFTFIRSLRIVTTTMNPTVEQAAEREAKDQALFNEIAEEYCRKDLHAAAQLGRKQRLLRTLAVADLPDDLDILEAGCGAGFTAEYLAGRFRRFHGIDYAQGLIDYANEHIRVPGATFAVGNIKEFETSEPFDAIVMIGVLHHLDDMDLAMTRLVAALKPGGYLLANEPQSGNPLVRAARYVRKNLDASYSDDQAELSAAEMRTLYERAGLTNIRIVPQGIFSTPFAEVPLNPTLLTRPLTKLACGVDTLIESCAAPLLRPVTWNLIASGQRPA